MAGRRPALIESRTDHRPGERIRPQEYRRRCLAIRLFLAVAAAAGLVGVVASRLDITSGPARAGEGLAVTSMSDGVLLALVAGAVAAGAAAATRLIWPHLIGLVGATLVMLAAAAAVVGGRASEAIAARTAVTLESGGILLCIAFGAAVVAVLGYLQSLHVIARTPPADDADRPAAGVAMRANAALGVGLLGLVVPLLASLAVALGLLANGEIRRSHNQLEGLGRALAGTVLGLFVLTIVIVAGIIGVAVVRPTG
jgi:hypothetical protein